MPEQGTNKTDRLKKRSDFLRLQQSGRKWVSPTVIVQADEGKTPQNRAGFTATKKLGGAVTRNRIKRRMRAAIRETLKTTEKPHDLVLIGRPETATCPYPTLLKDLKWCLKRLEVTAPQNKPQDRP